MPSPNLMTGLAIARFQSFNIQLPPLPTGGGPRPATPPGSPGAMLANRPAVSTAAAAAAASAAAAIRSPAGAASPPPPATGTPMSLPPALFRAGSNSADDVAMQKAMHDAYMELFTKLSEALKFAWDMFRLQAYFADIRIMAVSAIGTPGCLRGPELRNLIRTAPPVAGWVGWQGGIRDAFADGLDKGWGEWQRAVTVPGLAWYPAFAAFPGPMAPPMPNVPTPLVACPSAGMVGMTVRLTGYLTNALQGKLDHHAQFADAMAAMIQPAFLQWLPSQMVMLVMGKGPIPTFAPPYVPVGPVVGGDVLPTPGHLRA